MEFIIQNDTNKHLIVLVHGLNGDDTSWRGNAERFVENLSENNLVQENFDLALFTYGTKIFQINWFTKVINTVKGFLSNKPKEDIKGFNVGIESVSRPLESEIRGIHPKYQTITFIAHSMGGLVVKSTLTWLNDEACKKVELFISLSVPHIGAFLADFGSELLGGNPQIIDLEAMGAFTTNLNERFANLRYQPKTIYQGGHQDTVVPRQSAIPPNIPSELVENTADSHFSILLIKSTKNHALYNRVVNELHTVLQPFLGIEVDVPQNTSFDFFINTMASKIKIKVDISCFTPTELKANLRADKISSTSVEDFLLKIGDLSMKTFPKYFVKKERGTLSYTFIKNKSD
jgi:hypothetical protein